MSIGLLQGFEITGIELDRLNATETAGSTDFDYNVTAFHCDSSGVPTSAILTQGSDVYLCIETTAPNVEIADVRELAMSQGGVVVTTPIVAGDEDALTEVTVNGKEATIQYQIISAFFVDPNPDDIVATGSVLLAFTDDDGRRLLRSAKVATVPPRKLDDKEEESFTVTMSAQSGNLDDSGAFTCGIASCAVVIVAFGMAIL